ncbi:hypothetical protein TNIN_234051 [Trichonephila inaurata madagascariensis]|uniref:Uncharacterized protein n=1 Tax=Trichonephila inaurata madagascariensis TaxID=2747483 RepID=A0A8X6X8Y3_9ARAC|nr:hypothetical protein TNIN_234051 [Trichonephila inaurata madagascariensis]
MSKSIVKYTIPFGEERKQSNKKTTSILDKLLEKKKKNYLFCCLESPSCLTETALKPRSISHLKRILPSLEITFHGSAPEVITACISKTDEDCIPMVPAHNTSDVHLPACSKIEATFRAEH